MMEFHPVASIFPLMEGQEFADLVTDIGENGLHEPIWLHQDGRIIDGRNRYRACIDSGVEPRFQTYDHPDEDLALFVVSLNLLRRHLNESQRAMAAEKIANMRQGARTDLQPSANLPEVSQGRASKIFNVSERTARSARRVQQKASPEIIWAVERGEIAVSDAATVVDLPHAEQDVALTDVRDKNVRVKNLKAAKRIRDIQKQREDIKAGDATLPEGVFEVICIDPPWPYGNSDKFDPDGFRGLVGYPTMTIEDLAALELPAANDCVLWLWTTHRFMRHAFTLLDAWDFEEKVILTWAKDRFGVGKWLRSQSEFCILAVKGHPRVDLTNQSTILNAPLRQHSRKPDEFYELVESLCIGRRLDFFSREKREGWEQVGNDTEKFEGAA